MPSCGAPGQAAPRPPAPVGHGSWSPPGRGQVQTAPRLLTALPPRRPLKRKREGRERGLRKSPPPGRAAGANHSGRGATAGPVRPLVRAPPSAFPGHPRPARSPRTLP